MKSLTDVPSSARESRNKNLRWEDWVGKTATCPCGFDYVVGSEDEADHFVTAGARNTRERTHVGECPIIWGVEGAVARIKQRLWTYFYFPGDPTPHATKDF